MPVRYSKQSSKTGATIGTIVSVVRPESYTSDIDPTVESNNWNLDSDYPGWIVCEGQTLNVSEYRVLYNVIGNTYGGVPDSTFVLPDYRSKRVMGTGRLDGNRGSSISQPVVFGANGLPGGDSETAGSGGGFYLLDTFRQLPENSEITPGSPASPRVDYDINDPFLTATQNFTGVTLIPHGAGISSDSTNFNTDIAGQGSTGGFRQPSYPGVGGVYLAFGTPGDAYFNSLQNTRIAEYTLDLTGYDRMFIFAIVGTDYNGGEVPNQEDLSIFWPDNTSEVIIPGFSNYTGGDIFDYDLEYGTWREIEVSIPPQYRAPGTTIRFRQIVTSFGSGEWRSPEEEAANPNGIDNYAIQRIGLEGATIGGTAVDTFSLGTFRTRGFEQVTATEDSVLSGTITFGVGPCREVTVAAVPPHLHFTELCYPGSQQATVAEPGPVMDDDFVFFTEGVGGIFSFNRGLRSWPGPAGAGTGSFAINVDAAALNGYTNNGVTATLSNSNGVTLSAYGDGTGDDGGFLDYGASPSGQYLNFRDGQSGSSSFSGTRSATWGPVDASQAQSVSILAIAGTDQNGGERVNTAGESLRIQFNNGAGFVEQGIILPSAGDSGLWSPGQSFDNYDAVYADWSFLNFAIPTAYQVSNLQIRFIQDFGVETDTSAAGTPVDNFGIATVRLTGGGNIFEFVGSDPLPLQRHSHMVYWDEPNDGDTVPTIPVTFGTGGGSANDYFGGNNGLRSGTTAVNNAPLNDSIGDTITKTIDINSDMGIEARSAVITMSEASRTVFDSAISVRLEAAEELVLLSPYFRTKYLIKAY